VEERWEAIEDCERRFRATKLRVSTDNVGLTRLGEGLELVRIGAPLRPELAVWRYAAAAARRRRTAYAAGVVGGLGSIASVAFMQGFVAPLVGLAGPVGAFVAAGVVMHYTENLQARIRGTLHPLRIRTHGGRRALEVSPERVGQVRLRRSDEGQGWQLEIPAREGATVLQGSDALRATAAILPFVNPIVGGRRIVQEAASLIDETDDPQEWFRRAADAQYTRPVLPQEYYDQGGDNEMPQGSLRLAGPRVLAALEMIANDDVERRAMDGELRDLEAAWRDAEEIASIADNLT